MQHTLNLVHGDTVHLNMSTCGSVDIRVTVAPLAEEIEDTSEWGYPVKNPRNWACRGYSHRIGSHTGYDLNLNIYPYGNVDSGEPIYAVTGGVVSYVTGLWGTGGGMVVVHHLTSATEIYARYAHLTPVVAAGDVVRAGTLLGHLIALPNGAHLHFDMAAHAITRDWLNSDDGWPDPAVILSEHLDPEVVAIMCGRG